MDCLHGRSAAFAHYRCLWTVCLAFLICLPAHGNRRPWQNQANAGVAAQIQIDPSNPLVVLAALAAPAGNVRGQGADQNPAPFEEKILANLEWRSIGPANMGGRTSDIEGIPGNPNLVYAATASGGIWKTTNGGVSWKPIFDRQSVLSFGDIAVDPRNSDVIWAGTGEANTRNSISFGDGVYRSNDGGVSWLHLGLKDTERISRVLVHPGAPDTVYVAALGHAFGPNSERGVFKTTDGGKTWQKVLYIDDQHGAADLELDPSNPNILYAAMWSFERKPWTFHSGSNKGGVYRSVDGGQTWSKLTNGLPQLMGRIGVKVAPSSPQVVYVIVEAKEGTLYRSDDRGESFRRVSNEARIVSRGFYYTQLRVDPLNEDRVYAVASNLFVSVDGGKTFRSISRKTHVDFHGFWIDPKDPQRMWQGQDGGIAVSYDRGERWEYVNNLPLGQFYHVHADNRLPFYYVMGGLQDNGSWTGPSRTREPAGILNDDWRMVSFGDGFGMINKFDDPEVYLSESQSGNIVRTDFRTREQQLVKPYVGGKGGPASAGKYRFNWDAPLVVSPHDPNTVYLGGNVLFKSTTFGKTWDKISPDLTTNNPEKQKEAGGPIAFENTSAEYHCTLISVAESPVQAGTIWAGTDDGNLQLTRDGGKTWTNLISNVPGLPSNSPVSHLEPSRRAADTAYAAFDRHMFDDFRAYIFKTRDGGRSWTDISSGLPVGAYVHVVREDPKNASLIYAGTETGLYASHNGGTSWIRLNLKNLPAVAIHDMVVHPRENDLILATHGRSFWIFDDASPIQQLGSSVVSQEVHLFDVRPALRFTTRFTRYGIGDKVFTGPNPAYGALVTYYLKEKADEKTTARLQVLDSGGKLLREIKDIPKEKGLNRTSWDLKLQAAEVRRPPTEEENEFTGPPRGPQVVPGMYTIKLLVGEKSLEKQVEVRLDPSINVPAADLQSQFDHALRLRDMQASANAALRAIDSLREQLRHAEKTIKDRTPEAHGALMNSISDDLKQLDTLESKLSSPTEGLGYRGRSQLAEKLSSLFRSIDGVNAPPTPAQREFFAELQMEFKERISEVNKFILQTVPQWNEILKRHDAPMLVPGKPVDISAGND